MQAKKNSCVSKCMFPSVVKGEIVNMKKKNERKKRDDDPVEVDDLRPLTVIETMPVADLATALLVCMQHISLGFAASTIFINS